MKQIESFNKTDQETTVGLKRPLKITAIIAFLSCLIVILSTFPPDTKIANADTTANDNLYKITQASDSNRASLFAAVNADGSKIVFTSDSDFLSQGIPDGQNEIWLYDTTAATLQRITTASSSNRSSTNVSINGDGTKIAFRSDSDFLNQGIPDNQFEIWLYDTTMQTLTRVTTASGGNHFSGRPHISSDGNWIAFESDSDLLSQGIPSSQTEVWLYNVNTTNLTRLTTASATNRFSGGARLNSDGSLVVFNSDSDFLSQGIPFDQPEIWLLEIGTMTLTRVTTASEAGRLSYAPDIDDSGEIIVFQSDSDFLGQGVVSGQMEVWQYDAVSATLSRITTAAPALIPIADSTAPRVSGNGRYIVFESANDFSSQNQMGTTEIWLYDTATSNIQRITTAPDGTPGYNPTPDLNATGSTIVFHSPVDFVGGTSQHLPNEIWLYQPPTSGPELLMNYTSGAPGSYFSVTGQNFPANETAEITINGRSLGTVPVDAYGGFFFIITTASADAGTYFVTASVNPSATKQFVLDTNEPVRPQAGTGDTFDVPTGIAFTEFVYLPAVIR